MRIRIMLSVVLAIGSVIPMSAQESGERDPEVEVEELDRTEIQVELSVPAAETVSDESREEFVRAARFAARYHQIGDLESAVEQLEKADTVFPDHPSVIHNLAVVYLQTGRYREAQAQIDRYLDLYPRGANADQMMSMQIDLDFQKDLQTRVEKTQNYVELTNRASFEFEQGDYGSSLQKFRQAEELAPEDPAAVFNQSLALEATGDYQGARERLRRFLAVATDSSMRSEADRRIFMLEQEIAGRRTDLVCAFCGWRLGPGQAWCPRCWHGPYLVNEARWNARPCGAGATATRASFYQDGRVALNEPLSCLYDAENYHEALRYSRIRQRAIQDERKKNGWIYDGDVIRRLEENGTILIELNQGDRLYTLISKPGGVVLTYSAELSGGIWRLTAEDLSLEGQLVHKKYLYDASNRIVKEEVTYRAQRDCGHVISMMADYIYAGNTLQSVNFSGGSEGFDFEGKPKTVWSGSLAMSYDESGRLTGEVFTVDSHTKTVTEKPERKFDKLFDRAFPGWRRNRPIDLTNRADYCGEDGPRLVANSIDLRPFYSISPSIATLLGNGVNRIEVSYTYPSTFSLPDPSAP